jgi:hypothetical protein
MVNNFTYCNAGFTLWEGHNFYECAELCSKECLKVLYIVSCKKEPLHMCNVLGSILGSDTGYTYLSHSTNSVFSNIIRTYKNTV